MTNIALKVSRYVNHAPVVVVEFFQFLCVDKRNKKKKSLGQLSFQLKIHASSAYRLIFKD